MKPLFLLCGVWSAGFAAALLGLLTGGADDAKLKGTIVADLEPFCGSFVVETGGRFVTLERKGAMPNLATGDAIVGPLHARGHQPIDLVGVAQMWVTIEGSSPDLRHAAEMLRDRCGFSDATEWAAAW